MAESVRLTVVVDKSQLDGLKAEVNKLGGKTINLGINNKSKELVSQTRDETGKLVKEVERLNNRYGQTIETVTRYGKDSTTITKTTTDNFFKQEAAVKKQEMALYNATIAYEKYAKAQADAAAKTVTPMQKQVNAVTGVSNAFKSAKDSAEIFKMQGLTPLEEELNKQEKALKAAKNSTEGAAKANELLGDSLDHIVAKIVAWQVINAGVAAMIRTVTNAVKTMKAVDDELVTVRKVTGMDEEQLKALEDRAYEVSTALGVTAETYLNATSAFARAGYKNQSADLAELAVKTQLVGDVTEDVANQFLLSVDAAYKFHGSITELSKVLDGANELDNKYATSIEKIAEGLGTVAPVAAQMHVSVGELSAAIGTITAVTQRSGTEAARALRALMLNIVGDTKTEIDEGVTWTTGEIAGLRDVIRQYAPAAYEAAQATGAIINPMEAIGGLAQSMKDGLLTEQQLMEMVSDIGGKLRTSQLLALIQNWDMYKSMLEDFGDAVGSADKEVENALDSWTRKTNQLSNAWTQYISHLVETDVIKGGLDVLIGLVQALDSPLGEATGKLGLLYGALTLIDKFTHANIISTLGTLAKSFLGVGEAAGIANTAMMASVALFAKVAIVVGAAYLLYKAVDAGTLSYEEQLEVVEDLNKEYDKLYGRGSEYDQLKSRVDELTEKERERLTYLEGERASLEAQVEAAEKLAAELWLTENSRNDVEQDYIGPNGITFEQNSARQLRGISEAAGKANAGLDSGDIGNDRYIASLKIIVSEYADYYDGLKKAQDLGVSLQSDEKEFIRIYESLAFTVGNVRTETEGLTAAQEQQAEAAKRAQVETDKLAEQTKAVNSALGDFKNYGNLTTETMSALTAALGDSINSLFDEEGALNDAGIAAFEAAGKIDGVKNATEYLQIAAQQANYSNLIAQIQAAGTAAMLTAGQISVMLQAVGVSAGAADAQARGMALTAKMKGTTAQGEFAAYLNSQIAALNRQMDALSGTGTSTKSGGSGGSKSSSTKDAELERLKDIVTLRKSELSLMEANGASEEDRIAKMREIQLALHAQAEYLRSIGADASTINALSTEWWKLQNDILELTEKTEKALRDGAADALKNIADALGDEQNALKDITSEEEKRNAVLKARIALENALNERTVRQYNAKTGQWEWVANEKTVESARENLANAEKSLADFRNDAAYKALKAALNDAASAIKDGAMSFEEAYAYVKDAIANILGEYGVDFSDKLGSVGAALGGAGKGETIDRMRRNSAAWHGASEEERRALEAENLRLGTAMGWTRGEDGVWYDENGNRAYDYGGVLRGMGGIKATRRDELILPPDLTQAVLRPALDRKTAAALDMMRAIYGTGSAVSPLAALMGRSSIGTQNNGDTFVINGMDVSQRVSMGTTIGELATLAHRLPLRYNS